MSQYDFGNLESPLTGAAFINTHMEPWRDAVHSCHSGSSRPSYAVKGTVWLDTTSDPNILKMFDGTSTDITIGDFSISGGSFTPAGVTSYGGTSAGTANAQTLTPSTALSAYAAGNAYDFLVGNTNTTAGPTLNVSGLGAKTIKCSVGGAKVNLPIGGLQSGMMARVVYDGTDFLLLNLRPYNAGTNIASATTLNLDNATGDFVHITGTTTVANITLARGRQVTCIADGAFRITDGSGNSPQGIMVPGGANITTTAGDIFVCRGDADGTVRIVSYFPINNSATPTVVNDIGSAGGGTQDLDLDLGRSIEVTVDTSTTTFTVSNPLPSGHEDIFTIRVTNGGSQTVNWPASFNWPGGTAPTLTASGVDLITVSTVDGGTAYEAVAALDVK